MATRPAPSRYRPRRPTEPSSVLFKRLPLGFPLPPATLPMDAPQTKSVEYYRAAPTAPGMSYSIDLERVNPPTRPGRSSSDVAPLSVKRKPAAITVPSRPDQVQRPPRSPARQPGYFDETAGAGPSGPPGPPPMGPLPPIPDLVSPFGEGDPMMLRAAAAKERREARRQSKLADSDIAALERSMRRLSRISLASAADERTSGPTSPTSLDSHLMTPSLRAEKLLRRISRQSDGHGVRLPADYGRVGISGYSVPSSAPVSPGLRGVPPPLHERSELAYLVDKPALSVPMRRNVESSSSPGAFAQNSLGLGLGLASDSISTMPSITTMSTLPSDTLSTLPSDATITPESQTRATRLNSLSSATTASTTSLLTPVSPPTSTEPLPSKSPMSPPKPLRLKGSINLRLPTRPLALSPGNTRGSSPDIPDLLSQYRDSLVLPTEASYRESTVLPRHSPVPSPRPDTLAPLQPSRSPSPSGMVQPTRLRPGARPRTHSDLVQPDDVPVPRSPVPRQLSLPQASPMARSPQPRQSTLPTVGPKNEPEYTPRSSTESRVAVEDSGDVLDVPPMRQSLESQVTPRPSVRSVSRATRTDSVASERPASPDISYILRTTPRPTRKSSVGSMGSSLISRRPSMAPSAFGMAPPSSFRQPVPMSRPGSEMSMASSRRSSGVTASSAGLDVDGLGPEVFYGEQYDSADSDSDLDLATPLPHMMLRAGLLSPRSTIITEAMEQPRPSSSGLSARGEALRAKGEKVWKAEARRKVRHRDGRNLRDGVGLTTGLGWSDSEDEDAPSPLRRRLSSVLLAKAQSRPPSQLSRQSYTNVTLSRRSTYSNLDSTSVSSSSQSLPRTPAPPPLSLPITPSSLPGATRTVGTDEFGKLDFPMPPTATSWRGMPSPGLRKAPSNGMMRSASATSPGASGIAPPSSMRTRTPSTTSASASSAAQSPRTSASVSSRGSLVRPAPRSVRVNIRPPTGTRLSAPEALRQAEAAVEARRLSGA